jgi:hypothetical protein
VRADSRRVRGAVVAVVAAAALVPVWASPLLVTTDGPSHVYNALVADAVLSERAPYAPYLKFDRDWTRPDRAAQFLLVALGRVVGFETAERVVFTLAVAATLAGFLALLARPQGGQGSAPLVALAPAAGWLAQTWFVWMGFYDFALSLALYAVLLLLLEREPTPRSRLLAQAVFAGLYLTHFLTFAVGAGLALAVPAWRALNRRGPWRDVVVAAPALALLLLELGSGGTGAGALRPADAWMGARGLVIGDFVMSVHPLDGVAGALIMAAVWFALARRLRAAQREGLASVSGAEIFGLLLLILSVVGPDGVGEGGFVAIRLRCFGVITLLPSMAGALGAVRRRTLAAAAGILLVTLAAHGALIVRDSRIVNGQLALLESLFTTARVPEGAWVRTRFRVYRRGLYAIGGYYHIADRLAPRRRLIVLDDYETLYKIFPVSWRRQPDWATFRQSIHGLTVRLVPGEVRWPGALYVLHESDRRLQAADPRIEIGPTLTAGQFALTPVRRRH